MLTQEEIQQEKEYLNKVLKILKEEIDSYENKVKLLSNNIQEQMTYAWDKTNRLSDTEFVYALANIQKRSVYAENANKKVKNYNKMLNSAYFARIDFEDSEGTLPIYIGISSLQQNEEFYVYDWRAPISSMFYNSEIGDASFTIATGEKVSGKITLKRQYKIVGGEIKEIFDTDIQIIDSVLKLILSANANSKMKNIVSTIQKEQNEIIRKNDSDILVVQGPAGSGKTSIAMHKIAYLLYSERDKINNTNVMILSPNEIFNNYISDVLPEIGEDNVVTATYNDFAKSYISEFAFASKLEDVYEVVYASEKRKNITKFNEIRFKFSDLYAKIIDDFIELNKHKFLSIEEIVIGEDKILSEDEINKIVLSFEKSPESLYLAGKKIVEKVYYVASKKTQKHLTLEKLKKQALENLTKIKLKVPLFFKELYSSKESFVNFCKDEFKKYNVEENLYDLESIYDFTVQALSADKLEFQDITPYMFFKSRIIGIGANKVIKYVLIDEAQDYTLFQYYILSMLFKNSNITLLGDLNQSILPFNSYKDYNGIISIIKETKINATDAISNLNRTYRSTYEINEFAKQVIKSNNAYDQIDRHGDKVEVIKQLEFDANQILNDAITIKNSYNTVAIICKNLEETLLYKQKLENFADANKFRIVTKNDNVFVEDKIMIIPSYLSKGLEFDGVIISNASSDYYTENERNLFYVVLTRALHKLKVYYTKEFSTLLSKDEYEKDRSQNPKSEL